MGAYPDDFDSWPQEKKNQHFADQAAAFRESRRKAKPRPSGKVIADHT